MRFVKRNNWLILAALIILYLFLFSPKAFSREPPPTLFFENWTVVQQGITQQGLIVLVLENPDQTVEIKKAAVVMTPTGNVLAFWYCEGNKPMAFVLNEKGEYVYHPEICKRLNCKAEGFNL